MVTGDTSGESDLEVLIQSMEPKLHDDSFVFCSLSPQQVTEVVGVAVMVFRESEGTTVILPKVQAEQAGLSSTFPCRMITLTVHSSLNAVGFLAAITKKLAEVGISVYSPPMELSGS